MQFWKAVKIKRRKYSYSTEKQTGNPLGIKTVTCPPDKLFHDFESAAKDALKGQQDTINKYKLTADSKDIAAMLCFAETYNGLGYYKNGHMSPYIFSGTNNYDKGKYIEAEKNDGSGEKESVYDRTGIFLLSSILQ